MINEIREPQYAGTFYPKDPEDLKKRVDDLLSHEGEGLKHNPFIGLIVPHAGIQYSGKTAAHGFGLLKGKKFETVVLLGPSHFANFKGALVDLRKGWRTPLGIASIDQELGKEMMRSFLSRGLLQSNTRVFDGEHSLEVEIPFLQRVNPSFQFLPLLIGDLDRNTCESLAWTLLSFYKDHSLCFIASSDLYHGYDEEECLRSDTRLLSMIQNLEIEPLAESLFHYPPPACGAAAIFTLLLVAKELEVEKIQILHRTHSGEVTGAHSGYVVGYASLSLSG